MSLLHHQAYLHTLIADHAAQPLDIITISTIKGGLDGAHGEAERAGGAPRSPASSSASSIAHSTSAAGSLAARRATSSPAATPPGAPPSRPSNTRRAAASHWPLQPSNPAVSLPVDQELS